MGEFDKALEAGRRRELLLRSPHDARIGIYILYSFANAPGLFSEIQIKTYFYHKCV